MYSPTAQEVIMETTFQWVIQNWGNPLSPPGFLEEIKCRSGCCNLCILPAFFRFPCKKTLGQNRSNFLRYWLSATHNEVHLAQSRQFQQSCIVFFKNQIGRACVNDWNFLCVSWCEQRGQLGYEITGRSHVPSTPAIIMLMQKSMAAYSWKWCNGLYLGSY